MRPTQYVEIAFAFAGTTEVKDDNDESLTAELLGEQRVASICRIGHSFCRNTVTDTESRVWSIAYRRVDLGDQIQAIYFKPDSLYRYLGLIRFPESPSMIPSV